MKMPANLNDSSVYLYGRDKCLRPIVIINLYKLMYQSFEEIKSKMIYIVEFMHEYLLIKGKIENFSLIVDCTDLGLFNAPWKLANDIISIATNLYL